MKKLNGFTIRRLVISGLKCFGNAQTFDFGETTFITGRNGSGKSSIADAIAFLITGQPFFGDQSSDRLRNPDFDSVDVSMEFTDDEGASHTLYRSRKNSKMSVSLDGYPVKQADLNEIFGERDVFLSIFNPLYFIEELADNGKALLEKLLPPVPHEQVLAVLSNQMRVLLENERLSSPQTYLQNRRSEIRELEDALVYQQGQDDLLARQIREKELILAEYMQQADERSLTADGSLAGQIKELERQLDARKAEQYQSQYDQTIAEMTAELNTLYAGHARFAKLKQEGKCPTCQQSTDDSEPIRVTLSEIVEKGRTLKAQLTEAEALNAQTKAVFEQFKADDVARMEDELTALRERYDNTQRLLDVIEELQVWMAENSTPSTEKTDAINEKINEKKALVDAVIAYITKRAELTFSGLKMNRVSISLYDVIKKTGEVKDTFKFTYEGRSYRWLSLSEKIRAGLEVSELIKTLTGRCYPTFIDNGESVTVIDNVRPSGQVLYVKVIHGAPLTVTVKENTQAAQAA